MTQADLSRHLGITFQQVQKYEDGLNRITGGRLQELSIALRVPVAYFFPEPVDGESPEVQAATTFAVIETGGLVRDFAGIDSPAVREALRGLIDALGEGTPD